MVAFGLSFFRRGLAVGVLIVIVLGETVSTAVILIDPVTLNRAYTHDSETEHESYAFEYRVSAYGWLGLRSVFRYICVLAGSFIRAVMILSGILLFSLN